MLAFPGARRAWNNETGEVNEKDECRLITDLERGIRSAHQSSEPTRQAE